LNNRTVELYRTKNKVVTNAFNSVVANICLQHERNDYKTFLLTGCEPWVGTTTMSMELAISLSIAGWKTLLLDCDMRKDMEYKAKGSETNYGLVDYVRGIATSEDIICPTNWEGLDYVSSGYMKNDDPLKMLYSHNLQVFIKKRSQEYDYIIMDVPSINASVDSLILSVKADATILVAALDGQNKKYLENARKKLIKEGANVIGVIQNKVDVKEYRKYTKDYDYHLKKQYLINHNRNSKNNQGRQ
jgi:capsular exopolysaccharide synthesis family protein